MARKGDPSSNSSRFPDTPWDLLAVVRTTTGEERRAALDQLIRLYWKPVFAYLRSHGHPDADAEDLTQGFFTRWLTNDTFSLPDPARGEFRNFLLVSLKHFVAHKSRQARTKNRGTGRSIAISLDSIEADEIPESLRHQDNNPANAFDRAWAESLVANAQAKLQLEYEHRGRRDLFEALSSRLRGDEPSSSYSAIASTLGMDKSQLANHAMAFRRAFLRVLREECSQYATAGEELEGEFRHLVTVLSGSKQSGKSMVAANFLTSGRRRKHTEPQSITYSQPRLESSAEGRAPKTPDFVHFSAFVPIRVRPQTTFLLEIWAYLESQRQEVLANASRRSQLSDGGQAGPIRIARGAAIGLKLVLPGFEIQRNRQTLWWTGTPANVSFVVRSAAPDQEELQYGWVEIIRNQTPVATIVFEVRVSAQTDAGTDTREADAQYVRTIFASYASEDRPEVLLWARGAKEAGVDVFLDVVSLREGQDWEKVLWEQVPSKDRFCLFWSEPASKSVWVEKEWRCALNKRGIDYIRPIPFADPRNVPPPRELAKSKHFNDLLWMVSEYERLRPKSARGGKPKRDQR
jgi:DNA-directed RNA polymerase specialized sigma24 family protein